jgi:hypothetical protein
LQSASQHLQIPFVLTQVSLPENKFTVMKSKTIAVVSGALLGLIVLGHIAHHVMHGSH